MSAPIALLLHSFGSAGRSWAAVQAELGWRSLAPDLPGFGGAPPLQAPSVGAYADWVRGEMRGLEREVVLVGASMGGKIAMAVAARRPPGLRALIFCAPSPPTPEPIAPDERRRQLAARGDRDAAERSVGGATSAPPGGAVFAGAVADWLATDAAAWAWWWSAGSRETLDVAGVAPGALILAGEDDAHLGPAVQRETTAARLPGAHVRIVPGSRHLLALDAPAAVAHAIAQAG